MGKFSLHKLLAAIDETEHKELRPLLCRQPKPPKPNCKKNRNSPPKCR